MANVPYPLSGTNIDELKFQVFELIREIYEEKIGGADLGDVFSLPGDVLTLALSETSGLTKENNELALDIASTGGLEVSASGLAAKLSTTGGLESAVSGLAVKLDGTSLALSSSGIKVTQSPQTHEVDASEIHSITAPADTPASVDALRDDLVDNTIPSIEAALNNLGIKINNIIAKLETLNLFAS